MQERAGAAQQVIDASALTLGQRLAAQHRQLLVHRLDDTAGEVTVGFGESLDQVVHQLAARGVGQVLGLGAGGFVVAGLAHGVGLGLLDLGVLGQHALDLGGLGGVLLGAHGVDQALHIGLGGRLALDASQRVSRALACLVALERALNLEFVFLLGDRLRRRLRLDQALHAAVVRATVDHQRLVGRQVGLQERAGAGQQVLDAGTFGGGQRLALEHRQLLVDRLDDCTGEIVVRLRVAFEQMVDQVAARDGGDLPGLGPGSLILAGDGHGVGIGLGLRRVLGQHALDLSGLGGVTALVGGVDQALHIGQGGGVALDVAQRLDRILADGAAQGALEFVRLRGGQAALRGGVLQTGLDHRVGIGRQRALAHVHLQVAARRFFLAGRLGLRGAVAEARFGADQDAGARSEHLVRRGRAAQARVDAIVGLALVGLEQELRLVGRRHATARLDVGPGSRDHVLALLVFVAAGLFLAGQRGGLQAGLGLGLVHRLLDRIQLQARQFALADGELALLPGVRNDGQAQGVAALVGGHVAQHRQAVHRLLAGHRGQVDQVAGLADLGRGALLQVDSALGGRLVALELGAGGALLLRQRGVAVCHRAQVGQARLLGRGAARLAGGAVGHELGGLGRPGTTTRLGRHIGRRRGLQRVGHHLIGARHQRAALGRRQQAHGLLCLDLGRQQPAFAHRDCRRHGRHRAVGQELGGFRRPGFAVGAGRRDRRHARRDRRGGGGHAEIGARRATQFGSGSVDRLLRAAHRQVLV